MSDFHYPISLNSDALTLPILKASPTRMPAMFEDSTHDLWHCETVDGPMVLKACKPNIVEYSNFWVGMNALFGLAFPNLLSDQRLTAEYLSRHGGFSIPEVIAAVDDQFVLTRFLPGHDLSSKSITNDHLTLLAKHIAKLHKQRYKNWGDLHAPAFTQASWMPRLYQTIQTLSQQSAIPIPQSLIEAVLSESATAHEAEFVPIMPDFRWDQLRVVENGDAVALVDLDAFVIAPRSLELVLLMHVLTPSQFASFKAHYSEVHDWPDISKQKRLYQLLLFLMNVLGETNLTKWMSQI